MTKKQDDAKEVKAKEPDVFIIKHFNSNADQVDQIIWRKGAEDVWESDRGGRMVDEDLKNELVRLSNLETVSVTEGTQTEE